MPKASRHVCLDTIAGELCGKDFGRKSDLVRHRKIHTGDKPYGCSYCSKRFVQDTQRRTHENTHTGNAPHECGVCEATFTDPSTCCRHRREQHAGAYVCFVVGCGKGIARKLNFRKHLEAHGEYCAYSDLYKYWEPPSEQTRPRRRRKKTTTKRRLARKVESPQAVSFESQGEESHRPIVIPELFKIDAALSSSEAPMVASVPLPPITKAVVQSYESQAFVQQNNRVFWSGLPDFITAQNPQPYCSPSLTPPSLSSSLASPESSPVSSYPSDTELYPHISMHSTNVELHSHFPPRAELGTPSSWLYLPASFPPRDVELHSHYLSPWTRRDALSPLSFDSPMATTENLPWTVSGFSLLENVITSPMQVFMPS